jgi:hypothetical protein
MLNLKVRSEITKKRNYFVEGHSDSCPVSFKKLKTLCYIGERKVKGGDVHHISTTKLNGKTYELYHNVSKDMLHVNIIFESGKAYLCNFFLPEKINGMYTSVLYGKRGDGIVLLSKYENNFTEIFFDYEKNIYIFKKLDLDLYVEFAERKAWKS